jgi:hypothetical protein
MRCRPAWALLLVFASLGSKGVFAMPDAITARALLSQIMEQLRSQSYRRTEVVGLVSSNLSPDLCACSGTFVRFNTVGQEITRLGFTYIMRNAGSWKIVVAVVHEPIAG